MTPQPTVALPSFVRFAALGVADMVKMRSQLAMSYGRSGRFDAMGDRLRDVARASRRVLQHADAEQRASYLRLLRDEIACSRRICAQFGWPLLRASLRYASPLDAAQSLA